MGSRQAGSGYSGVRLRGRSVSIRVPHESGRDGWVDETVDVPTTPAGLRRAAQIRAEVIDRYRLGVLTWRDYFPNSSRAERAAPVAGVPTFEEISEQYLRHCAATMSPSTIKGYRKSLSIWGDVLGPEPIEAIRKSQIMDVVATWGWTGKTLSNRLTALRGVFDLAIDDELIGRNPAMRIKAAGAQRPRPRPLTPEEITSALAACAELQPTWLPFWQVAIGTGMRPSEQIELQWSSVDMTKKTTHVHEVRVENQHRAVTKNRSVRDVDMTELALRGYRAQRKLRISWGEPALKSGHVFLHPSTLEPIRDDQPSRRSWNKMLADAGIEHRKAYSSRCTFACNSLSEGVELTRVSQLLGHASPRMTLDHYAEWIPKSGASQTDVQSVTALS